jgi:hypothetical protein
MNLWPSGQRKKEVFVVDATTTSTSYFWFLVLDGIFPWLMAKHPLLLPLSLFVVFVGSFSAIFANLVSMMLSIIMHPSDFFLLRRLFRSMA